MSELLTNGDWRERLRQAIADKKTSMRAVSIEAGLGEGAVHSWLGKDQKDPSITHLLSVCRVLGITLVWLTKGYNITPAAEEVLALIEAKPAARESILTLPTPLRR